MITICVIGLGFIGLPLAVLLAHHGKHVIGVDNDPDVIIQLNNMHNLPESGLKELLQKAVSDGRLTTREVPGQADAFILAVPTPLLEDGHPDLNYLKRAVFDISGYINKGNTVIVESTVPVLTTKNVVQAILEEQTGLSAGSDFYLAYCPERVLPGKIIEEMQHSPRVIGGINKISAEKAAEIYCSFCRGEIILTDCITAELTKLAENTYRMINIALANELAKVAAALGANIWETIACANLHPRVHLHYPGPGVGGHCIPVDPLFLVNAAPQLTPLIQTASHVNEHMVDYVVEDCLEMLAGICRPRVAALGFAYKANTSDTRMSPALKIITRLRSKGVDVRTVEPFAKDEAIEPVPLPPAVENADLLLLLVDHDIFKGINPEQIAPHLRRLQLYDTRNFFRSEQWEACGFTVRVLGSPANKTILG